MCLVEAGEIIDYPDQEEKPEVSDKLPQMSEEQHALIEWARFYSEGQVEIWQTLPHLALQADGRLGWSDSLVWAYSHGLWVVQNPQNSPYYSSAAVDLATGKIVSMLDPDRPASGTAILAMRPDDLDAQSHAARLIELANADFPGYNTRTEEQLTELKADIAKHYNVAKIYERI